MKKVNNAVTNELREWAEHYRPRRCQNLGCNKYSTKKLHLDHCHTTGRVRGWLCMQCNTAFGLLGESEERILGLIKYKNNPPLCNTGYTHVKKLYVENHLVIFMILLIIWQLYVSVTQKV